jgi:hypothetical protein
MIWMKKRKKERKENIKNRNKRRKSHNPIKIFCHFNVHIDMISIQQKYYTFFFLCGEWNVEKDKMF